MQEFKSIEISVSSVISSSDVESDYSEFVFILCYDAKKYFLAYPGSGVVDLKNVASLTTFVKVLYQENFVTSFELDFSHLATTEKIIIKNEDFEFIFLIKGELKKKVEDQVKSPGVSTPKGMNKT